MRKSFPSKPRGLSLAITLASASLALPATAQDQGDIEEVLVTGSYIRGSALDAPSPVTVVDRASIEAQGASVIWDVIRNLEVNQGSDTSVAGTNDAGQLTGTASVNLRNLGGNSTLTLINGKRMAPAAVVTSSGQEFVDLNTIPLVMTERIEVLTDGGSALYGSDAVAGVVNVIMRDDFEGLELYGDVGGIEEAGGSNEQTLAAIWGWGSDDGRTNFVISGEYFERDPVGTEHSSWYSADQTAFNGKVGGLGTALELGALANPAYVNDALTAQKVAEREALGRATSRGSTLVLTDPLCETLSGPQGAFYIDNRFDNFGSPSGQCSENTLVHDFIAVGQERYSVAGTFNHQFNDNVEFYSFFQYSDSDTEREGDGYTRSRSVHLYLPPPGTAQGPTSFIFDALELGRYAAAAGNTRPTAADITNAPLSIANGGLGTAMYGGTTSVGWPRPGNTLSTTNEASGIQAGFRGEFEAGDRAVGYDISASWSSSSVEQNYLTLDRQRTELAMQGLGGPNCTPNGIADFDYTNPAVDPFGVWAGTSDSFNDIAFPGYILNLRETFSLALTSNNHGQGGCQFYNPFLTALTDPNLANSQELVDWMVQDVKRADKQNKMLVIDAVFNTELFDMAGGTAQIAGGFQYRDRNAASIAPQINQPGIRAILGYDENGMPNEFVDNITGNLECSQCIFNFDHDRDVRAAFVEFSLPFAENVETQVALRWEDYGGNIGSELTPKIAMSWRPFDDLLVRGSFSQSFRAPNIGVVFESFESFGTTVLDPISSQRVRAGLDPALNEFGEPEGSFTVGAPNPNLGNESADTYSLGFQWTPSGDLEGLSVGTDFWKFEVSDRVLPQVPRAAIQPQIDLFNSLVGDESNYILNTSYELDAEPRFVPCSPSAIASEFGVDSPERLNCVVNPDLYDIPSVDRLAGSTDADLVTIVLPAVNAGNIDVSGVDIKLGYTWDSGPNRFRVGLDYTHVHEYLVNDIPGLEAGIQETGRFDAAGVNGEQAIVRTVPDNKGNISFSWSRDNHRVSVFNRHIGSFENLGYNDFVENPEENAFDVLLARPKIDSYDTWDIQYNYTHSWANSNMGTTIFTVGVIDATDEDVPLLGRANFDRSVFDARGRRWYARALWQF